MVQARSRCHWRWVQLDFLTAKVGCTGHRRSPFVGGQGPDNQLEPIPRGTGAKPPGPGLLEILATGSNRVKPMRQDRRGRRCIAVRVREIAMGVTDFRVRFS